MQIEIFEVVVCSQESRWFHSQEYGNENLLESRVPRKWEPGNGFPNCRMNDG